MIRIESEILDWNKDKETESKRVHMSIVMDMLTEKEREAVEQAHQEFLEKVKAIVPDNPPAPGVRYVG